MKKKILIILLALIIPICLLFAGCVSTAQTADVGEEFVIGDIVLVKVEHGRHFDMFVDKKTKVIYIYNTTGNQGGLTAMLDSDGKPLIYEGEL